MADFDKLFDGFLDAEQQVKIPVGGEFLGYFIAPFMAGVVHKFNSEVDLAQMEIAFDSRINTRSGGYQYYYKDPVAALEAAKAAGAFNPQPVWRFETPLVNVISLKDEDKEKFKGDSITKECRITTLQSAKHRHEFHLITLPSAVAAMAKLAGLDVPEFDLSELQNTDSIYTDEFQEKMIGGPNAVYTSSVLWQRRKALWEALGEKDPGKYTVNSSKKTDTESDKLAGCLRIVSNAWKNPLWIQLVAVPDPKVDATWTTDDGTKRQTLPTVRRIFKSEAEAREFHTEMLKKAGIEEVVKTVSTSNKPLPKEWIGMEDEWKKTIDGVRPQLVGKPKPTQLKIIKESKMEEDLLATPDEIIAWL
jgi:hypothetical protein